MTGAPPHVWARLVAAHGLAGAILDRPGGPLDDAAWRDLVGWAGPEGLLGRLAAAAGSGALPVTAEQAALVRAVQVEEAGRTAALEQLLVGVAGALDEAGVPHRVLDEPAVGRLCGEDPGLRPVDRIELLVDVRWRGAALVALAGTGLRRRAPRPVWGAVAGPGRSDTFGDRAGREVLVHSRLPGVRRNGFGESLAFGPMATLVGVAGRQVAVLGAETALLHAAWRATLPASARRLARVRDVADLVLGARPHLGRTVDLAARSGAERVLAAGVRAAWEEFQLADAVPLSVWARRSRPASLVPS